MGVGYCFVKFCGYRIYTSCFIDKIKKYSILYIDIANRNKYSLNKLFANWTANGLKLYKKRKSRIKHIYYQMQSVVIYEH